MEARVSDADEAVGDGHEAKEEEEPTPDVSETVCGEPAGDPELVVCGVGGAPGGFRALYAGGAGAHYAAHGASYRNPHEAGVVKALLEALPLWGLVPARRLAGLRAKGKPRRRTELEVVGPEPVPAVAPPLALSKRSRVLDLAAGSGEVSLLLDSIGLRDVVGCDPYTGEAYAARVGRPAEAWSFEDVANGCLGDAEFDLCVCCYALHLVDDSWMAALLWELARCCSALMIVSPHKRPVIPPNNGFKAADPGELRVERVRVRLFWSTLRLPV